MNINFQHLVLVGDVEHIFCNQYTMGIYVMDIELDTND